MGVKVTNNAFSTLAGTLETGDGSFSVQTGHGARFPTASVASGDYFYVTLIKTDGTLEIVKVTNRTTDTFTITRAQDDTTAKAFAINDRVELRPVAAMLNALPSRSLVTADYTDASVTTVKLGNSGVTAGSYGGLGKDLTMAVNSKGQVTSISETSAGVIQTDTFSFTTAGATQTWTKPAVGSLVRVQLWGGGGGGSRGGSTIGQGGGGGGGYTESWLSFSALSSTASIVIGGGGAGRTGTAGAGANGVNSTFTSGSLVLTAYAGAGGQNSPSGGGGAGAHAAGNLSAGGRMGGGTGAYEDTVNSVNVAATDATMPWGGGGGGFGVNTNASSICNGGYAIWGGGGGGGGFNGSGTSSGGVSIFGGSGGNGATDTGTGSPGATPAGGGGGSEVANAGNGGNGRCTVTVY